MDWFGSQRRTVVSDKAAARKRSIFAPAKNYPNAPEYGVWRFSEHCTRVNNFSRMQRLYRHNLVRAGQPSQMP